MEEEVKPNSNEQKPDEISAVSERLAKLKALNDSLEAERLRAEKLKADELMGGKSVMAQPLPVKTKTEELNELLANSPIRLKDFK